MVSSDCLLPAPPVPQHTFDFLDAAPTSILLKILSSYDVKLSPSAFDKQELERRLRLLISDSQRLNDVLPLSKTKFEKLKKWDLNAHDPLLDMYSHACTLKQGLMNRATGQTREIGENAHEDVAQTQMHLAKNFQEMGSTVMLLQDERQTSALALRILEFRECEKDKDTPIIFLFFTHSTRDVMKPESKTIKWINEVLRENKGVSQTKCQLPEQHLLVRTLLYNSRRLPRDCEAFFEKHRRPLESEFIPSFWLPMDALKSGSLDYLNRAAELCTSCKKPAEYLCSACGITPYCSVACQRAHRTTHTTLCSQFTGATRVKVKLQGSEAMGMPGGILAGINMSQGSLRDMHRGSISGDSDLEKFKSSQGSGKLFIIKVQTTGDMPMMIYDSARSFQKILETSAPGARPIKEQVERNTRWGGRKAFLWARAVEEKDCLEIFTGAMPSQEQRW